MIPGDYCRCTGKDCERKETCARYIAWRDKIGGEPRTPVSESLCGFEWPRVFEDHYIEVTE